MGAGCAGSPLAGGLSLPFIIFHYSGPIDMQSATTAGPIGGISLAPDDFVPTVPDREFRRELAMAVLEISQISFPTA